MASARRIGFLIDGLLSRYQVRLFDAVRRSAQQRGALVVGFPGSYLVGADSEPLTFDGSFVYELVSPSSVDGIIVASNLILDRAGAGRIRSLQQAGQVPMVSIGPMPGVTTVDVDNRRGLERVIEHLIVDHGRRRLAFIRGPVTNPDSLERERVYRTTLAKHGIEPTSDLIVTGNFLESSGAAAVRILLDERHVSMERLDAIVAANDQMATGAMQELNARGVRIPEDLVVVGFDDDDHARSANPPLTTVAQPIASLGAAAVGLLIAKLEGQEPAECTILDTIPILRRSCGCNDDPQRLHPSTLEDSSASLSWLGSDQRAGAALKHMRAHLCCTKPDGQRSALREVERLVLDFANVGIDPVRWQDALDPLLCEVSVAQPETVETQGEPALSLQVRSLQLRCLFSELSSTVALKEQLRTVELANSLRVIGSAVVCARHLRALGRVLDAGLPSLDVRYCCVCTFTNPERTRAKVAALYHPAVPRPHAQMQSAEQLWRSVPPTLPPGANPSSLGAQSFASTALLPTAASPSNGDLVVFPLVFGEEALGYVVLDAPQDAQRAWLLEGLSGHLSSAIYEITRTEQLRLAREQAEEANSAKTAFVATMSHEVRTPLNAIMGNLDLCLRTDLSKEQRKQLLRVQSSSRALRSIIDDILDYSRIEARRIDLESVAFELEQMLEQIISTCASDANRKGLEFVLDVDCTVPRRLVGDPLRLTQVLLNLVNNSIKFSSQGFVALRITRCGEGPGPTVLVKFSVEDTGIGIGPDQVARIFQPFTQADSSMTRRYGGTGLGLTICQRLVELMGGEIQVRSVIGTGSSFEFTLPLLAETEFESVDVGVAAKVVLAIESSAQVGALQRMLEDLGQEVIPVHTGTDALRVIEELRSEVRTTPYYLFADHRLSDMTGGQLLTKVHETDADPCLRTVLMVPHDNESLLSGGWQNFGGETVLVKPPLRSSIERILGADSSVCRSTYPPMSEDEHTLLAGYRILVVQDSEMSRELACDILSLSGAEVQTAFDGAEAIRRVYHERFDLILMDLNLPIVDGCSAAKSIREDFGPSVLPIVALSASSAPEDRIRCIEAGMNDFLRAPIGAMELIDTLRRCLGKPEGTGRHVPPTTPPATTRGTPNNGLVLDAAKALGRLGGNRTLYQQLLKRFLQTHADSCEELARALDDSELTTAANVVHVLVSAAGNIGATRLQYAAQGLESALRQSQVSRVLAARPRFEAEWHASIKAVNAALERYREASQPPAVRNQASLVTENIEQLRRLIHDHDTAAVELVDRLRETYVGDPHTELALRQLAHSVTSYDFDAAQLHLAEVSSSLAGHVLAPLERD